MNMLKRTLAMFLVLCLTLGALPFSVFATESTDTTESAGGFDAMDLTGFGLGSATETAATYALTMGTKPADGTTTGEPFPQGTGSSNSFRIPALVTLSDGTLVAAADARWNTTYDGGGLDTIVSRSSDGGANWNYTFANYLGDNGNEYNGSSSCFIDPALAVTSGDTIYMLVDLYPYGVALNGSKETTPATTVGFYDNNKLKLSNNSHSSYDYYLNLTDYKIYSYSGNTAVTGYTVDKYFNITSTDGTTRTNLFFSDSPYKVVRTGFLYLTKSTDKGATWSEPTLLNLKTSSEMVCLVGPGRGLVTSTGMIVFPVYSYNGSSESQKTGFIYSTDGTNWSRSANFTGASWSSESAVVELSDGTLRFFYRNGTTNLCYVDYANNAWGSPVTTSVDTNSNCQISAITYSKTIDGKQVILVSCPTGPNEAGSDQSGASYRLNGKIFAFTVESDKSLSSIGSIAVTSNGDQFMYSCLTELNDGTVGILYEDKENAWGTGANCYYTMSYAEYDLATKLGVTFDVATVTLKDSTTGVTVSGVTASDSGEWVMTVTPDAAVTGLADEYVAFDVTIKHSVTGETYSGRAQVTLPVTKLSTTNGLYPFIVTDGTVEEITTFTKTDSTITFTAPHFSVMGAAVDADAPAVEITDTENVRIKVGETSQTYTDTTGDYSATTTNVQPNASIAAMKVSGNAATTETTVSDTAATTLEAGATYIIRVHNTAYALSSKTGSNAWGTQTLAFESNSLSATKEHMWTLEAADGGYKIKSAAGYLNLGTGNNTGYVSTTGEVFTIASTTTGWTIKNQSGEYINALGGLYNYYSAGGWTGDGTRFDLYKVTTATEASTEVSFTGVSTGTTTAIVGTTQYNITVYDDVEITVNYQADGTTVVTKTMTVASDAASVTLPATVADESATYAVANTTLDLTAGTTTYNVAVTELEGTEISIKENETMELSVTLEDGQYVEWTTSDSSYVGVAGKYDATANAYTNTGVIIGHNVTTEPTLVTGTVYNADGSVASVNKWLVTVEAAEETTDDLRTVKIKFDFVKVQNCTIYYSINGGELIEVKEEDLQQATDENGNVYYYLDAVIDSSYTNDGYGVNVSFFAAPDEGYALTYMGYTATGAETYQYFAISNGNPDGTGCEAWPFDEVNQATVPSGSGDSAWKNQKDWYEYYSNKGMSNAVSSTSDNCFGYGWALLQGNMTLDQWKIMMSDAIAKGCDGAQLFTKNANGTTFEADLTFIAEPLPTVSKTLNGVLPTTCKTDDFRRYDGENMMEAHVGEYVYFTITVTLKAPNLLTDDNLAMLTYSNGLLTDNLEGAYFYTKELDNDDGDQNGDGSNYDGIIADPAKQLTTQELTDWLNAEWTDEEIAAGKRVVEYYVVFEITPEYLDKDIINTVDLTYHCDALYSDGVVDVKGSDVADIHVTGGTLPNTVIDFGQKVVVTDTAVGADGTYGFATAQSKVDKTNANLQYGSISFALNDEGVWTMTYTPTTILLGAETVYFYNSKDEIINTALIYPATSVYYEEGFMFTGTSKDWTTTNAKMATVVQTTEMMGRKVNSYGYDPIYAENSVTKSWAETATLGATTTFTFTGTGFELYANCTEGSGYVSVRNKNTGDVVKVNKLFMIDTDVDFGKTGATTGQTGDFDTLPIVSVKDLEWNTYEVTIVKTHDSEPIYIDGVRIINTIKDSTIFTADKEDNPAFYQLRDMLLNAMAVGANTEVESERYGTAAEMAQQVYDQSADATGLITFEEIDYSQNITDGEAAEAISLLADLLDNGPKNELFLYAGNTFTFKVTTNRALQIGLKAPQADVEYSVTCKYTDTNDAEQTVNWLHGTEMVTSADMYYELGNPIGTEYTYTVTISVAEGILSITDLKICDDPNATFEPLTVEDIEKILIGSGYPAEETPEETEPEEETTVDRLAGANRFDTAMVIADQMKENLGVEKFDAIIVASGTNFADALAGSYLASVKNAPILLTYTTDAVNDSVKAYIQLNLNEGGTLYILGGETAVPASMETGMDAFVVKRLNGTDRFSTNLAILKEAGVDGKDILVCTGLDFADSLSASASNLPILLVWKDLTKDQKAFLEALDGSKLYIIGGKNAVDGKLEKQLEKYGEVIRIGGRNRFETSVLIAETFFKNPESAVLAYAWNYPDGLCGGTLASSSNAPLVLTMTDYESAAAEYISTHGIGKGTVLGGDGLISDNSVKTIFRGRGK